MFRIMMSDVADAWRLDKAELGVWLAGLGAGLAAGLSREISLAWPLLVLCLTLVYGAALAPGGGRWWASSLRLLTVWLLTLAFLGIIGSLALTVLVTFGYAVEWSGKGFDMKNMETWAKAATPAGRMLLGLAAAVLCAGLGWIWSRVSLSAPASLREGRVRMLSSWPTTRGRGWIILATHLAAWAPLGLAVFLPATVPLALIFGLGSMVTARLAGRIHRRVTEHASLT